MLRKVHDQNSDKFLLDKEVVLGVIFFLIHAGNSARTIVESHKIQLTLDFD